MSAGSTRRGFLAGAAAAVAAPAVARGQAPSSGLAGKLQAKQKIVLRGRALAVDPRGRRAVVAHDRRRTVGIVGTGGGTPAVIDVGGQPAEVAVSPDGGLAAVTTGFWDKPGLVVVDLDRPAVRTRIDLGAAPGAVAFDRTGKRIAVAGGEQEGSIHVFTTDGLGTVAQAQIGPVPRGIALERAGTAAWIALNGDARVVRVDLHTGRVKRSLPTPALPDRVAISPDGRRLLVTHGGRDAAHVSEVEIKSGRVHRQYAGELPSGVGWTAAGERLVALGGENAVVRLGGGRRHARRTVGVAPRGLATAGRRAWTVSALTGELSGVRT
jgi:DNA-binding beta-propeller fold protein YncE